ncbi:MAG: hypothetical protein SGPRY_010683 [Prymnesium sp.]
MSLRNVSCLPGHTLSLPERAFHLPPSLQPLLSELTHSRREALRLNKENRSVEELTDSIANLNLVDVDNSFLQKRAAQVRSHIRVAELNAQRGRYWCEIATLIASTPALASVDVWLLNELDLGMARSEQQHTARLLAYALGFNYAWAAEFVELSNGNSEEQLRTTGKRNKWGLHGNALFSRWALSEAMVVRMPGMSPLYHSSGPETAHGYEKRLGARMTLFAKTFVGEEEFLLGTTHAQTSWRDNVAHTTAALSLIKTHLLKATSATGTKVLLGGDTWAQTCEWLGLDALVQDRSPSHRVTRAGDVVLTRRTPNDDYVCSRGLILADSVERFPCIGIHATGTLNEYRKLALSDHVFVVVTVGWATMTCDAVYRWFNPLSVSTAEKSLVGQVQRYRDNDELRFSMRSFSRVSGFESFHVVARGSPPMWLDATHLRVFWWDETTLLTKLRAHRGITSPLKVHNSEPSKLAIAYIPNLAERFVLIDDDFFILPHHSSRGGLSMHPTFFSLFAASDGLLRVLPVQPSMIRSSHRPVPMLRSAYLESLRRESTETIEMILTSGSNRDQRLIQFCSRHHPKLAQRLECRTKRGIDRLPLWCERMQKNLTAARSYETHGAARLTWKLPAQLQERGNYDDAHLIASRSRSMFTLSVNATSKAQDELKGYGSPHSNNK